MNRLLSIAAIVPALFATGCGLNEIDVPLSASGSILAGAVTAGMPISDEGSAQSAISTSFSSNGVKTFKAASITAGSLTLKWANPNSAFQTEMTSFTVSISAMGQPPVQIANIPASTLATKAASYSLTLDAVELKPYIDAGAVAFQATPTFASPLATSVMLNVNMTLHVQIF